MKLARQDRSHTVAAAVTQPQHIQVVEEYANQAVAYAHAGANGLIKSPWLLRPHRLDTEPLPNETDLMPACPTSAYQALRR